MITKIIENKLTKMIDEAARNASNALSKLSGQEITVEVLKAEITKIQRKFPDIEPKTMVAGIYFPITGDVKGAALLIFPEKLAYDLCNLLFRRGPEITPKLTELDKSALKETGNIICGSLLTVFSNTLKMKIVEHLPEFSLDMFGAVIDVIIAEFAQNAEDALVIQIKFVFQYSTIKGYVFLFFGLEETKAIIKALETEVNIGEILVAKGEDNLIASGRR